MMSELRVVVSLNRILNTVSPSSCVDAVPGILVIDPIRVTGKLPEFPEAACGVPLICMISSLAPDPKPTKMKSPFSKLVMSSTGSNVALSAIVETVLTNVVAIIVQSALLQ